MSHAFTWRGWRVTAVALLSLLAVIVAFYAVEDTRGWWTLKRYRAQAGRNGLSFDYRTFVPPPAADADNFAAIPFWRPAFDYTPGSHGTVWHDTNGMERFHRVTAYFQNVPGLATPSLGDWTVGQRVSLEQWQSYYRGEPAVPSARSVRSVRSAAAPAEAPAKGVPAADVLLALTRFSAEMREIQMAAQRPRSRFPIHYDEGPLTLLPHLGKLRNLAMMFQLEAAAHLASTNSAAATSDIDTIFRLADAPREEPFLISELVRAAMLNQALQVVWEGMCDHRWSDRDLAGFQVRLSQIDIERESMRAFAAEHAFVALSISHQVQHRDRIMQAMRDFMPGSALPAAFPYYIRLAPSGWLWRHELVFDRWLDGLSAAAEQSRRTGVHAEAPASPSQPNIFLQLTAKMYTDMRHDLPATHVHLDLARVACALERFRLAHAEYPVSLDALGAPFMDRIPVDFINGAPLHYRRLTSTSFVLYSVGPNGMDDGGTPFASRDAATQFPPTGDIVWRIP